MEQFNLANNPWLASWNNLTSSADWEVFKSDFVKKFQHLMQLSQEGNLPELRDRRFRDAAWAENPQLHLLAHLYVLSSETVEKMTAKFDLPKRMQERLQFSVDQWLAAIAPSNFFSFNAEALKAFQDTSGESLQKGMQNWMDDLRKGRMTQTDETAFEVGVDLAVTEGSVVFENKFFQLIQYQPKLEQVFETPMLLVPPCINKFYVMDLQKDESLVQYLVEQGHNTYLISWRNPLSSDDDGISEATWDDYIEHGILKAMEAVQAISGQPQLNVTAFCVGGTMTATAISVLKARGIDIVKSLTLLTTFLDFSETGVLDVFIDESMVLRNELKLGKGGLASADMLNSTFSWLRPNELVWNYVVSRYFKGEAPAAFNILYWNADSTNLPGPFYAWYLRNTYLENNLAKPDHAVVCGEKINFGRIDIPSFVYASIADHIVPWDSGFASAKLISGPVRFVLGASGHIAGVINPPHKNRRNYWVNENTPDELNRAQSAGDWLAEATEKPGSWWPAWAEWLVQQGGRKIRARKTMGSRQYPVIEPAPGRYVKVKAIS
ncbi:MULTISPECIES: PHA/PHB synthase family protein [Oligella]|uniref:Poly-beta-hydroxybutyrate polymerase n=1 Tax=Oligella urethralis TaxID=90245 RepID=A0A2X1UW16_9BURK|nr:MULTISPECIES: alpha/beta fold hydrolase [Oligella]OFS83860.1 class I poly(R)-hydroxyalkanoic acid synthase [Oligella sp. HMSC05A10]SPY07903.1 Poly-beta-hydroxybutyrate polymerase [Oligella urethralis]SUA54296.1 Poly-beta-hydroxybutyrate polymerase [Oligella urethralis]